MQKENPHFKATNLETLRNMVAANIGIALMPKLAAKPTEGICYIPFNNPKPFRTVGMVYRPGSPLRVRYERLAQAITQITKAEV